MLVQMGYMLHEYVGNRQLLETIDVGHKTWSIKDVVWIYLTSRLSREIMLLSNSLLATLGCRCWHRPPALWHSMSQLSARVTQITHINQCSVSLHSKKSCLTEYACFHPCHKLIQRQVYSLPSCTCASVHILAHGRAFSPSRSVTNYLIKFHCIKATFMNLA